MPFVHFFEGHLFFGIFMYLPLVVQLCDSALALGSFFVDIHQVRHLHVESNYIISILLEYSIV